MESDELVQSNDGKPMTSADRDNKFNRLCNQLSKSPDFQKKVNTFTPANDDSSNKYLPSECPLQRENSLVPILTNRNDVDSEPPSFTPFRKKSSKRVAIRALCWAGWIICCPIWTCITCLREEPFYDDDDDDGDDACWPCTYDVTTRQEFT